MPSENAQGFEGFLKSQADEGEIVSEGASFTLDAAKAWDKVTAHAMPFPYAWVLKLVQAAVLAECPRISVTLNRVCLEFTFSAPQGWTDRRILEAFLNYDADVAQSLKHLSLGLRSLAKELGHRFELFYQGRCCLDFDGVTPRTPDGSRDQARNDDVLLRISSSAPGERSLMAKFLRTAENLFALGVITVLGERAFCCPVPLYLDGRRVVGPHAHPGFSPSGHCRTLLLVAGLASAELPGFDCPLTQDWETGHVSPQVTLTRSHLTEGTPVSANRVLGREAKGYVVLLGAFMKPKEVSISFLTKGRTTRYYPDARDSLLAWVKDGIVVETEKLCRASVGVLIVVSAQDLETDISGFQLVRSAAFVQRRVCVTTAVGQKLTELTQGTTVDADQQVDKFSMILNCVAGVVGLIVIVPGLFLFLNAASQRSREIALEKELEDDFSQAMKQVLAVLQRTGKSGSARGGAPSKRLGDR